MKSFKRILFILLLVLPISSCIDREIPETKDGVVLPPVTDLKSTILNDNITVSWTNPTVIPDAIQRPISIYVQVYRGGTLEYQRALADEPNSWQYILAEPGDKYRVVVKTYGYLKEKEYGKSDELYSLGQTIDVN